MMTIPDKQLCYIHIPRTGGTALQHAIQRAFPTAQQHGPYWEHVGAHAVRRVLPSPAWRCFTMIRNPWRIFQSHWGFVQRYRDRPEEVDDDVREALAEWATMEFPELVRHLVEHDSLATDGGFCERYTDAATIIYQYESPPWLAIAELLGHCVCMERENKSLCEPPLWDADSVNLVGRYCRGDVERFGYGPPTT